MENLRIEQNNTWTRKPDEIRIMKAKVADTVNRLQMVLRGEALRVREALDIISIATSTAGFHLDREEITVFIEGRDGRRLWEAEIGDITPSIIYYDMYIHQIYTHEGDCTIILDGWTEEEPEEPAEEDKDNG